MGQRDEEMSDAAKALKKVPAWIWVSTWVALNVSLTLINKAIFQFAGFVYPLTLSAVHMLVSSIFSFVVVRELQWFPRANLGKQGYYVIVLFSFVFSSNIALGNASLRYASVSLVQVIRATIPGMTMILSIFILGKKYSFQVAITMLPICVGMMLTVKGEVNYSFLGLILTFLGCMLSAMKVVFCNKFLVGQTSLHPLDLLDKTTPLAFLQLLPVIYFMGEYDKIVENWEAISNPSVLFLVLLSATNAFLLNITNFFTNQTTSPLVLSVSGNIKQCASIIVAIFLFSEEINVLNATGIFVTVVGTLFFNLIRAREKQEETRRASASKV